MKIKALVLTLIGSLLTGCVVAVIAGAAGMVVYDRRSVSMIERDARIFYVLNNAVEHDPRFRDSHLVVSSFSQVVLIAGQTPVASLRELAEKIAKETPNVRRVYNEITVDYPTSLTQRSKDTWITSQVRSIMLSKKGLESGSFRAVTENGTVYLMGIATHEQADLAVDVARHVNGVTRVVKVLQYIV